jgi:hypothetical protein
VAGIARQPALDLFSDDLPKPDLGGRLGNTPQQRLARGSTQMVEAAGRPGAEHVDRGEIGGELHVVVSEVRQHREHQLGKPIFQQKPVAHALEQMVIEMLVRVDEAGNDGHPAGVDGALDGFRRDLCRAADAFDLASIDQNKSARMHASAMIDGYHVTVFDQDSGHVPSLLLGAATLPRAAALGANGSWRD